MLFHFNSCYFMLFHANSTHVNIRVSKSQIQWNTWKILNISTVRFTGFVRFKHLQTKRLCHLVRKPLQVLLLYSGLRHCAPGLPSKPHIADLHWPAQTCKFLARHGRTMQNYSTGQYFHRCSIYFRFGHYEYVLNIDTVKSVMDLNGRVCGLQT